MWAWHLHNPFRAGGPHHFTEGNNIGSGPQWSPSLHDPCRLGVPDTSEWGKGKGKVLGRSPNSSVSVIPTCPKALHPTAHNSYQNNRHSGTVNWRDT